MVSLSYNEKKTLRLIASFYGAKVLFKDKDYGEFWGFSFHCPIRGKSKSSLLSIFFHELAHLYCWDYQIFSLYNDPKKYEKIKKHFKSHKRLVNYALKAEIRVEEEARRLMKEWVGDKYCFEQTYFNNAECKAFLDGVLRS